MKPHMENKHAMAKWRSAARPVRVAPGPTCSAPYNHLPETTTSGPFLSIYKWISEAQRSEATGPKSHSMLVTLLDRQPPL